MSRKRKQYTPAYRHEAARLVIDTRRPIVQVARESGVGEALLGRWVSLDGIGLQWLLDRSTDVVESISTYADRAVLGWRSSR